MSGTQDDVQQLVAAAYFLRDQPKAEAHYYSRVIAEVAQRMLAAPGATQPTDQQIVDTLARHGIGWMYASQFGEVTPYPLDGEDAPIYIGAIREILAGAPVAAQEPVEYQRRVRPTWRDEGEGWTEWEKCSPEAYADYLRVPVLNDLQHEVRVLYAQPAPAQGEPASLPADYTDEQLAAGLESVAIWRKQNGVLSDESLCGLIFDAMRAAAPAPAQQAQDKRIRDLEIECATLRHGLRLADRRYEEALAAPAEARCKSCGGNDGDMPCAYPGEAKHGCLRDTRLAQGDLVRQLREHDDARLYREADVLMNAAADRLAELEAQRAQGVAETWKVLPSPVASDVDAIRAAALEEAAAECERLEVGPFEWSRTPAHNTVWDAAKAIRGLASSGEPIQESK